MANNKHSIPVDLSFYMQLYGHDLKEFVEDKAELGYSISVQDGFNSVYLELQ